MLKISKLSKYFLLSILIISHNRQLNTVGRFTYLAACTGSIGTVLLSALTIPGCYNEPQNRNSCLTGTGMLAASLPIICLLIGNECDKCFGYLNLREIKEDIRAIEKNDLMVKLMNIKTEDDDIIKSFLEKEFSKNDSRPIYLNLLEKAESLIDVIDKNLKEFEDNKQWRLEEEYQEAKKSFEQCNNYVSIARKITIDSQRSPIIPSRDPNNCINNNYSLQLTHHAQNSNK